MAMSWQRGLGLIVFLTMTASASAQQFPKDFGKGKKSFDKKFDGGKKGAAEVDRVRNEVNELRAQIDQLKQQIGETNEKVERLQGELIQRLPDKVKGGPKKMFDRPMPPMADAKGPKNGFGNGGFPGGPGGKGKGPAFAGGSFGSQSQNTSGGFQGPGPFAGSGPPGHFTPPVLGALRDLENSIDRLERAIDDLRREMRARR